MAYRSARASVSGIGDDAESRCRVRGNERRNGARRIYGPIGASVNEYCSRESGVSRPPRACPSGGTSGSDRNGDLLARRYGQSGIPASSGTSAASPTVVSGGIAVSLESGSAPSVRNAHSGSLFPVQTVPSAIATGTAATGSCRPVVRRRSSERLSAGTAARGYRTEVGIPARTAVTGTHAGSSGASSSADNEDAHRRYARGNGIKVGSGGSVGLKQIEIPRTLPTPGDVVLSRSVSVHVRAQ
jgi:hypothetical protein